MQQREMVTKCLIEFFSTNTFFFDALTTINDITAKKVCTYLHISNQLFKNILLKANIQLNIRDLQSFAKGIDKTMLQPPPVYIIYQKSVNENFFLDDRYLELLLPMNENHFDFKAMINSRFIEHITKTRLNLINSFDKLTDYMFWDFLLDLVDEEKHAEIIQNTWDLLPQCIKKLTDDEKFLINNELSVAFLHGTVTFPLPGISSPHLHGYFNFSGRKPETGYLSLDNLLNRNNKIPKEKTKEVMDWLQHNNPLYKDFTPLTFENIHFRINPSSAPMGSAINMAMIPNTSGITNDGGDVFIRLKKQDGTLAGKFIPLEKALPLCFPILFPSGKIEKIPGKTLREKARFILSSHPFLRCGRLACHLVLFLYSIIMDHDTAFIQNGLSIQRLNMTIGANRNLEPDKFRSDDPPSPIYWSHRQAEVRAMCSQF